jgi:radical SAM protein with 4Fe4S-binding SPASM domain
MCPHGIKHFNMGRNNKNISMSLIQKLIDECNTLEIPSINIGGFTECTINPHIMEILAMVKGPHLLDRFLFTNGSMLSQELCDLLIDLQFERVYISLDAATAKTYKTIRGYDLSKVESNIKRLLATKKQRNSQLPLIRVSFCIQDKNQNEIEAFYKKWENKVDIIDYQKCINFDNARINNTRLKKCEGPFTSLSVTCDGDILPCCTEYGKEIKLGNLADMSLLDAWKSIKMIKLREVFTKNNEAPEACMNCSRNI